MKRIYYSLLCLLAFLQVGIAQTREIKTQVGGVLFLPEEITALLGYSPLLENQEYQAEYYELPPKDEVLGVRERVLHGRFFAKYPQNPAIVKKSDTLIVTGKYQDGKMVGRWLLEDLYVDIEDGKLSYTINDTLTYFAGGYKQVLTRKLTVLNGVLQGTAHLCLKEGYDDKPLKLNREIIVPVDENGWANGLIIDRISGYEYRYHYHHGFLISSATINTQSGETTTQNFIDKATFIKQFNPKTGEIIQEDPVLGSKRYQRVPSVVAGKIDQGRWGGLLGSNLLIYPALTRAFASSEEIVEEQETPNISIVQVQ